jgi:hypothetical protein
MTPWQTNICLGAFFDEKKRQRDHDAWLMWHGAVLQRIQKIPPLDDFLLEKKPTLKTDKERAIVEWFRTYQAIQNQRNKA